MGSLSSAKWRQVAIVAAAIIAAYLTFKLFG